jgi:NADPH:quinone reductase
MKAILFKKPGDYSKLSFGEIDQPKTMKSTDIVIKQTAIGINHDDILIRSGKVSDIKIDTTILGFEAVGIIEKVGSAISKFKVGQRVGYGFSNLGAYCEKRVIDAGYCLALPDDISDENGAAILRKGLAAHSFLFRTHVPRKDQTIFVTGAGSGVGQIIARWAKFSGLKVIGGVGSESKKDAAISAGCDCVVNINNEKEALDKIEEFTDKKGVSAVYDSVGKTSFNLCIKALSIFGVFVQYGCTSGEIDAINLKLIEAKCLFMTKPRFEIYKSNRNELIVSAYELFDAFKRGAIITNVSRYSFSSIPNAHKDIELRKVTGSVIATI